MATAHVILMIPGKTSKAFPRDPGQLPNYKEIRAWVGGLIQPVYLLTDPLGYWSVGYVDEESLVKRLPLNEEASKLFTRYEGLHGPCVYLEGFQTHWWQDAGTSEYVRPATKAECLKYSQSGRDSLEEDGRTLLLTERE